MIDLSGREYDARLGFRVRRADASSGRPARLAATVSGSFQRSMDVVGKARARLMELGVEVLSPPSAMVESKRQGFTKLVGDPSADPRVTEDRHLDAISGSDFLWLVSPDGDLGPSASLEVGYSRAAGVPTFTADRIRDLTLREYVSYVSKPEGAIARVRGAPQSGGRSILLDPVASIAAIREELDRLEPLLSWSGRPMTFAETRSVRAAVARVRRILGNILDSGGGD